MILCGRINLNILNNNFEVSKYLNNFVSCVMNYTSV